MPLTLDTNKKKRCKRNRPWISDQVGHDEKKGVRC